MADEMTPLSAKEKLALSRRALVLQLYGDDPVAIDKSTLHGAHAVAQTATTRRPRRPGLLDQLPWVSMGKNIAERWWRRHPANAVGQLARPLLDRYARKEPGKLIAGAAALGALVILIKPWRLLSATALVAALLKTSDIADMVTTLLNKTTQPTRNLK